MKYEKTHSIPYEKTHSVSYEKIHGSSHGSGPSHNYNPIPYHGPMNYHGHYDRSIPYEKTHGSYERERSYATSSAYEKPYERSFDKGYERTLPYDKGYDKSAVPYEKSTLPYDKGYDKSTLPYDKGYDRYERVYEKKSQDKGWYDRRHWKERGSYERSYDKGYDKGYKYSFDKQPNPFYDQRKSHDSRNKRVEYFKKRPEKFEKREEEFQRIVDQRVDQRIEQRVEQRIDQRNDQKIIDQRVQVVDQRITEARLNEQKLNEARGIEIKQEQEKEITDFFEKETQLNQVNEKTVELESKKSNLFDQKSHQSPLFSSPNKFSFSSRQSPKLNRPEKKSAQIVKRMDEIDAEIAAVTRDLERVQQELESLPDTPENQVILLIQENKSRVNACRASATHPHNPWFSYPQPLQLTHVPLKTKALLTLVLKKRKHHTTDFLKSITSRYLSLEKDWKQKCLKYDFLFETHFDKIPNQKEFLSAAKRFSLRRTNDDPQLQRCWDRENHHPELRWTRTLAQEAPMLHEGAEKAFPFVDNNGQLAQIDPPQKRHWTEEEKKLFIEKYLLFPKNFGKIAQFLSNKTSGDCVAFYYAHKRDMNLKKLFRQQNLKKRKIVQKKMGPGEWPKKPRGRPRKDDPLRWTVIEKVEIDYCNLNSRQKL